MQLNRYAHPVSEMPGENDEEAAAEALRQQPPAPSPPQVKKDLEDMEKIFQFDVDEEYLRRYPSAPEEYKNLLGGVYVDKNLDHLVYLVTSVSQDFFRTEEEPIPLRVQRWSKVLLEKKKKKNKKKGGRSVVLHKGDIIGWR